MVKLFDFLEGATPISDCSGLITLWLHNLEDLNRIEAENIMRAHKKIFTKSTQSSQRVVSHN